MQRFFIVCVCASHKKLLTRHFFSVTLSLSLSLSLLSLSLYLFVCSLLVSLSLSPCLSLFLSLFVCLFSPCLPLRYTDCGHRASYAQRNQVPVPDAQKIVCLMRLMMGGAQPLPFLGCGNRASVRDQRARAARRIRVHADIPSCIGRARAKSARARGRKCKSTHKQTLTHTQIVAIVQRLRQSRIPVCGNRAVYLM